MALRGTLANFGIADVFSLIGSQSKTGILKAENRDEKVTLYIRDGGVVRSEATRRQRQELIGGMLVRAEAVTEDQLQQALGQQQATRRRLGDLLIESGAIASVDLQTFTKLQTTETVYRMFLWRSGTYEFNQTEEPPEAGHPSVRAETLLMEGFRQADEWPKIRPKLTSYAITFDVKSNLEELLVEAPVETSGGGDDLDFDFGDGSGGSKSDGQNPRLRNIDAAERRIYSLIAPGRDIQRLIDLSRLGEFETCKALVNLMDADIIAPKASEAQVRPSAEATVGGISASSDPQLSGGVLGQAGWIIAVTVFWLFIATSGLSILASDATRGAAGFLDMHLEPQVGRAALQRIGHALAVYRAAHGSYPETLNALVQDGLLQGSELRFPWHQPYIYSRNDQSYTLLRPLY